jgi:hypothetical protein
VGKTQDMGHVSGPKITTQVVLQPQPWFDLPTYYSSNPDVGERPTFMVPPW